MTSRSPAAPIDTTAGAAEAKARAALDALHDVTWSVPTHDDLRDVEAMLSLVYDHEHATERQSLADLYEYFDSPRSHPELHDLVGRASTGEVVALAQSRPNPHHTQERRVLVFGCVTPDRRGNGLGRAVMAWELAHAAAWDARTREPSYGPLVLKLYAESAATDAQHLALRLGLPAVRWFNEMSRPLDPDEQIVVPQIEGVRIVRWDPALSAAVHRAHDAAFGDHWGSVPMTDQQWAESVESHAFRADWSLVALDGDAVVGYALNFAWTQDWEASGHSSGYTDSLGVVRSHRGRGVAKALLLQSMQLFRADGMAHADLGVDTENPSGAVALYTGLGYQVTGSNVCHQLTVQDATPLPLDGAL